MFASPGGGGQYDVPHLEPQLTQFFRHPRTTITVMAKFVLLSDMRQQNHVIALTLAHGPSAPGTITTLGHLQNPAHPAYGIDLPQSLYECKTLHFWLAKKTAAFLGSPSPRAIFGSLCEARKSPWPDPHRACLPSRHADFARPICSRSKSPYPNLPKSASASARWSKQGEPFPFEFHAISLSHSLSP